MILKQYRRIPVFIANLKANGTNSAINWNQAVIIGAVVISGKTMNAPDMQQRTLGTHAIASTSLVMMLLSALNARAWTLRRTMTETIQ